MQHLRDLSHFANKNVERHAQRFRQIAKTLLKTDHETTFVYEKTCFHIIVNDCSMAGKNKGLYGNVALSDSRIDQVAGLRKTRFPERVANDQSGLVTAAVVCDL